MAKVKSKGPAVLTANDLLTGVIVFWDGIKWARTMPSAARAATEEERAALAEIAKIEVGNNVVVDAYLFEIDEETGLPLELREQRRLAGPSILLPTPIQSAA